MGPTISACWDTPPPRSRQSPPPREQADTPCEQTPPRSRHPLGSRHPPWEQTPPGADTPLWEQTPPEQTPLTPPPPGGDPLGADPPPGHCMLGNTVNKRAVRILLECNLVYDLFLQGLGGHGPLGPLDPLLVIIAYLNESHKVHRQLLSICTVVTHSFDCSWLQPRQRGSGLCT